MSNSVEHQESQDVVVAGAIEDVAEEEMATNIGNDAVSAVESADGSGSGEDA